MIVVYIYSGFLLSICLGGMALLWCHRHDDEPPGLEECPDYPPREWLPDEWFAGSELDSDRTEE